MRKGLRYFSVGSRAERAGHKAEKLERRAHGLEDEADILRERQKRLEQNPPKNPTEMVPVSGSLFWEGRGTVYRKDWSRLAAERMDREAAALRLRRKAYLLKEKEKKLRATATRKSQRGK